MRNKIKAGLRIMARYPEVALVIFAFGFISGHLVTTYIIFTSAFI